MRTRYILKNINISFIYSIINTILSFVLRTIFIKKLGTDYLGLNSILTNILSMLSIAELGIGTAIGFSLYKPLADNNKQKINSLMHYYKNAYMIVGIVVFFAGIILIPFLENFIKDMDKFSNIYFIYILFLLSTVFGYFFSYKRTLIIADQKNYILTRYLLLFKILTYLSQILVLIFTGNYILYICIQFSLLLLENIYVNHKINERYNYLKNTKCKTLDITEKKQISKNVRAMFFHKIGDYCVNSTDNLIIAHYINLTIVGLYSNYYTLIYTLNMFLMLIFENTSASFGNLIAAESKETVYNRFKVFNFLAFWIFGFSTLALYFLLTPFIDLWLGSKFIIDNSIVLVVMINFFFVSMRVPLGIVKTAAGIYSQDKFIPLIQSIVNLVTSIILVKSIGLLGVFVGTLISSVLVVFWARPYIVYKYVFKKPITTYFKCFIKYFIILLCDCLLISLLFKYVFISNKLLYFMFKCIIIFIIPNITIIYLFKNKYEFKQLFNIIKNLLWRKSNEN